MMNKNKLISTTAIALVIALLGGTSAFAEKAVPGDMLYGVKVSVNEKAAGAFAFSKIAQTKWKERLVERRLEEAQKVVSGDALDESTRIILEEKIKTQIDDFNENLIELKEDEDESEDLSEINIRLQASLRAHQGVLEKVLGKTNISDDTRVETEKLVSVLKESKNKVKDNHEDIELELGASEQDTLLSSSASANHESALGKQTAAENVLNSVKLLYQREKINLSANIQSQIDGKLALVETAFQEGKALIVSADYVDAFSKFQLVISGANSTRLLVLSNVIKGNIEDDMDDDDDEEEIEDDDDINDDELDDEEDDGDDDEDEEDDDDDEFELED